MLAQYRTDTWALLQLPTSNPQALYPTTSLDRWINIARGQVAGEGECIRYLATIDTVANQRNYDFADLNLGTPATNGIRGAIHIRSIRYGVAEGSKWMTPRPWEWFELYKLNNPVPDSGVPATWAQYGQGSGGTGQGTSATGSFYIDPVPNMAYTLYCDCVCYPIALETDATVEALPYLWTDAVPFFAAYYALLSSQTSARINDAEKMMANYKQFMERARRAANPSPGRWQYSQAADPAQAAKMGVKI